MMIVRFILALAAACTLLLGYSVFGVSQTAQAAQDVYPKELQGTQSFELGELVLLLMPDRDATFVGWGHRADSPITWKTTGYEKKGRMGERGDAFMRAGIVRVHIQGRTSTVLRQHIDELGWTVQYWSSLSNPKFGPEEIEIRPGLPTEFCFGTNYDGCDFEEPLKSLAAAGIGVERVCNRSWGTEAASEFLLTNASRRPTILLWTRSGGSGGMSASLTLKLREQADPRLCDRLVYTPPPPSTSNRGQPDGREPTAPFELTLTSSSKGSLTRSTVRAQFIETANVEYEGRVLSLRVIRWTLEIQEGDNLLGGVPFLEGEMCDEPDRVSVHVQLDANGHVLAQGQRFVHYGEDAFGIELNRWACGR